MDFISVKEFAALKGLPDRTVRNYCASGKILGAFMMGKTWVLPEDAVVPTKGSRTKKPSPLLRALREQKEMKLKGGIYHRLQIDLTYNSNHIEGSRLSHDQTRFIFETHTIAATSEDIKVDDVVETVNHFRLIDKIIYGTHDKLSESLIKDYHRILKNGTSDSLKDWFAVGDYKRLPNEVGGQITTNPENVHEEMAHLLSHYNSLKNKSIDDILDFHYNFEKIHPFQDGNGRVGRIIMFKECLANDIVPFIITDEIKSFYYRGLREWGYERGYLRDTCLSAQDSFKEILDYFRIKY